MGRSDDNEPLLPHAFLRACRRWRRKSKVADSGGADLTGGNLLLRTLILRRLLLRTVLAPAAEEKFVGLLLPPSVAGVVANAALPLCGRVGVNLNYTASSDTLNYCLGQCNIKHVLTSRRFMEKFDFKLEAELVYLEDFKDKATLADKAAAAVYAFALPQRMLERRLGLDRLTKDDLLTVIFTSGSTGRPKGVMLSYGNVGSNATAIDQVINLTSDDVICGILPFFHCFGLTVTLWTVLSLDLKAAYHFSPLDAQQIGKLCAEHAVTIMLSTPTFLRSYLRRCRPEQFSSLDVVVTGAEKLPLELSNSFEEKFGVRPVEGYGATELSPLVSVNIPPSRQREGGPPGLKEGTVGRPVPGVSAKLVHPDTLADLGVDETGLLLISGPNVMQGYLGQPELTSQVIRDGWYITGDMARIDASGFLTITGRQSRFSKIGGEMVPHLLIEEEIEKLVGGDHQELCLAVAAVPDERKGERLVVLHTPMTKSVDELTQALQAKGLPKLWIPGNDSFFEVDTIPVLGTGKLDLQAIKRLAAEKVAAQASK